MIPVVVPQEDVNSETCTIVGWHASKGGRVRRGDLLLTVETSKAVLEIAAPGDGILLPVQPVGVAVPFNVPIAYLAESDVELLGFETQGTAASAREEAGFKATRKARQLAMQYGLDLTSLGKTGIIAEKDVLAHLQALDIVQATGDRILTQAGELPVGLERIVVLGAGLGAMQVLDILMNDSTRVVVGLVDDDPSLPGQQVLGLPVLGASADLGRFWRERRFDAAIISIATSIAARVHLYDLCQSNGIPLANAIDPTVRINRFAKIGKGNVICSLVHIGTCAVVGDNNFISAHCNLDHHNLWGSHNTTGPGCLTSSRVKVGDRVKMGSGVVIQPGLAVGDGSQIASGAVIIRSIPPAHAVKTKITTEIVPL